MNDNVYYQIYVFALCCVLGIVLAIIFDVFRVIRRLIHTGVVLTFVEDMIFWILSSVLFFVLTLKFYNGEFRVFMVVGIMLGAITYFITLSKFFVGISVSLIVFLGKILDVLLFPLKLFLKLFNKPLIVAVNVGRRSWRGIRSKFVFNINFFDKFVLRRKSNVKIKKL